MVLWESANPLTLWLQRRKLAGTGETRACGWSSSDVCCDVPIFDSLLNSSRLRFIKPEASRREDGCIVWSRLDCCVQDRRIAGGELQGEVFGGCVPIRSILSLSRMPAGPRYLPHKA